MPLKKAVAIWEQSIKELLAKYDLHPIEELIKLAREEIVLKEGDEQFIGGMMDDYRVVDREDGKRVLKPKLKHLKDLWSEVAQYVAPKLRATETKGQIDYNFNITIRKFDEPAKVTDAIDVSVKEIGDAP